MKSLLVFFFLYSLAIADDRFLPQDWFAGILEKTSPESTTSIHLVNEEIIGISTKTGKCQLIFYSKNKPKNIKILYVAKGIEHNAIGKEEAVEYKFEKGESIYNFLLGFEIKLPSDTQKIIFSLQFAENDKVLSIQCNLDEKGEALFTRITSIDAKQEFGEN
jgi:hypothetical protein